jgi:AraC-like DNA-binding protein
VYNIYSSIASSPDEFRQLKAGGSLITIYNCPLDTRKAEVWSHHNYIVYVMEGRKVWHTSHGSYDLKEGSCVFVKKGASIVEQFFDTRFCFVLFFVTDEFVCEVLKSKTTPIHKPGKVFEPVIPINNSAAVRAFFHSMMPHFESGRNPDESLLDLKFREIILTLADNPGNAELLSYFSTLLQEPQAISLQQVMEDNFCFNLKLEEYAKLSSRSLSAFKRDFQRLFATTPGKWLMEKRLKYAYHLLKNQGKTVSETAFESGFESPSHFSRAFRQRFGKTPASLKQSAELELC